MGFVGMGFEDMASRIRDCRCDWQRFENKSMDSVRMMVSYAASVENVRSRLQFQHGKHNHPVGYLTQGDVHSPTVVSCWPMLAGPDQVVDQRRCLV